jgi:hypothetical protein
MFATPPSFIPRRHKKARIDKTKIGGSTKESSSTKEAGKIRSDC